MIFKNIAILDDTFQIRENQYVQIRQDKIVYIGEQMPETGSEEEFDGKDKLMIPGMVNTHTHVPMTLLRGYGENLPLDRWLNERIFLMSISLMRTVFMMLLFWELRKC